jgi:hypothetical protein
MKLKNLSLPLAVALLFTATACSSGSSSQEEKPAAKKSDVWPSSLLKTDLAVVKPRTKNAAPSSPLKDKKSKQTKDNGVLTPPVSKDNSASKTDVKVGVSVQTGRPPVLIPSDFCKLLGFDCASLNFTQFYLYGPTNFKAVAEIPNSSIKLPAGKGFAFTVLKTYLDVFVDGENSYFEIFAKTQVEVPGYILPIDMRGRYTPAKNTIEIELMNNNVGLKNFLGISGLDINSISGKVSFTGVTMSAVGISLGGTLPTFLKEIGVNPGTQFTTAIEVGYNGLTLGMSIGSQDDGSPNIFNFQNMLSARYMAFSYSTTGSTIGGVDYPEGFALAFDGKFSGVSVVVNGVISFIPITEFQIDFAIGGFSLGGFEFEDSIGTIARTDSKNSLSFSGGLAGYGVQARMKGSFDASGGIEMDALGLYTPFGVNLGEFKFYLKSNTQGFEFKGIQTNTVMGVMRGRAELMMKSFPGKKFGFHVFVSGNLAIPGWPSYGTMWSQLQVWNCRDLLCGTPDNAASAKVWGATQFYGDVKRDFEFSIDPNNWKFSFNAAFWYDKTLGYDSDDFEIDVKVRGWATVNFSNTGVYLGNSYMSSSAGFSFPPINVPAVTTPTIKVRAYKLKCTWRGCRSIGYWIETGGVVITPAYTIPGGTASLGAGIGNDSRGFFVDVAAGSGADGGRVYFD